MAVKKNLLKKIELSDAYEKSFFFLALILSIAGLVISGIDAYSRPVSAGILAAKDFSIFVVLLILAMFFFLRYRQVLSDYMKDTAIQEVFHKTQMDLITKLITEQLGFYHQAIRQTRASFYSEFGAGIYPHRFSYRDEALRSIMEKSLAAVVSVTMNIIKNQQSIHAIQEKTSVSVKAIVTGKMAKALCTLTAEAAMRIDEEKEYIITLARDSETTALWPEREVREAVYPLNDNTDFNHILSETNDLFLSNNLTALEEQGLYRNNNPNWKQYYNSTIVLPISHRETTNAKPLIFGFLTVDSLNETKEELFSKKETKPIVAFGADLLALIFLHLEIYDRSKENGIILEKN